MLERKSLKKRMRIKGVENMTKVDEYKGFNIYHTLDGHYVSVNERTGYEINSATVEEAKYDIDTDESEVG